MDSAVKGLLFCKQSLVFTSMWYPWILFYIYIVMVNRLSWTHNLQHQPNPTVASWGFCELHFQQNTCQFPLHFISWHCTTLLYCVMRSVHFLRSTLTCEFHQCTTLHISSRICDIWKVRKCVTCDKIELEILAKLRAANPWKWGEHIITEVASGVAEIESHQNMLTSPAKAQG